MLLNYVIAQHSASGRSQKPVAGDSFSGQCFRDPVHPGAGNAQSLQQMFQCDKPSGPSLDPMIFNGVGSQKKRQRNTPGQSERLHEQGIIMAKGKEAVHPEPQTDIQQLKRGKKMKKSPEQVTAGPFFRPGKTMEITVGMVDGKRNHGQVVDGMPPVKKRIDGPK